MKDRTERVELTVLCMVCDKDHLLLQNRVKEDWKGYTFPGGHIEPGESIVGAVIREIKEETGLTIRNPRLCGVKQFPIEGGRYIVFLFRTEQFEGIVSSSSEGEMRWIHRRDLPQVETVEDFEEMLSVFEREDLTEFQYVVSDGNWEIEMR